MGSIVYWRVAGREGGVADATVYWMNILGSLGGLSFPVMCQMPNVRLLAYQTLKRILKFRLNLLAGQIVRVVSHNNLNLVFSINGGVVVFESHSFYRRDVTGMVGGVELDFAGSFGELRTEHGVMHTLDGESEFR